MNILNRKFAWISILFSTIILALILFIIIARILNASASKITTKEGIQENIYVKIGGIKQFLQIRGKDKNNPLILWLHGGPGYPLTYLSYYYQRPLEKDYTIVSWDQRGCGRTYYKNDNKEVSIDLLLQDTDELVDYLLKRFKQEKIIIAGQSWGTVLGSTYIKHHPEKVAAYIGIGQVIDFDQGKIFAAEKALATAKEQGNYEDVETLQKTINIFKESKRVDEIDIKNLEKMIILSLKYLKNDKEISNIKLMWAGLSSPYMSLADFKWFLKANNTEKIFHLEKSLIQYMYYDFEANELGYNYNVPIYYIQGDSDWITPTPLVAKYYKTINAPKKNLVVIKDGGHTVFLDQPEKFCNALIKVLNK